MRFMRGTGVGPGVGYRLFEEQHEIGYIREGVVGIYGFEDREAAARAAGVAHGALEQRRGRAGLAATSGEYLVRGSDSGPDTWGFEIQLLPEERHSIFAMSRARTVWRALRWSGARGRMRQFAGSPAAAPGDLEPAAR